MRPGSRRLPACASGADGYCRIQAGSYSHKASSRVSRTASSIAMPQIASMTTDRAARIGPVELQEFKVDEVAEHVAAIAAEDLWDGELADRRDKDHEGAGHDTGKG